MKDEKITENNRKIPIITPSSEFYANLKMIKETYEAGLRIKKHLYLFLKTELNWKMTYKTFNKYFNQEFQKQKETKTQKEEIKKETDKPKKEQTKPTKGFVWDEEQEEAMRQYQNTVKLQEEMNQQKEKE